MSWRIVVVHNTAKLDLQLQYLVVRSEMKTQKDTYFRNSTSACGIYVCIADSWIVGGINETESEGGYFVTISEIHPRS